MHIFYALSRRESRAVSSRFELHSSVMQSRQIIEIEIVLSAVVTFKHIFIKSSSPRKTPHTTAPPRNRSMLLVCIYGHEEKPIWRDFQLSLFYTRPLSGILRRNTRIPERAFTLSRKKNVEVGKEKYSRRQSFAVFGYHLFAFSFSFAKKAFLF